MTFNSQRQQKEFWDNVHKYENSIKKRDIGLYNEILFIDGVLY